jgi:hypothetical protein
MTRASAALFTCPLAFLLALPASAHAATCTREATVTSGAANVVHYSAADLQAGETEGKVLSGDTIKRRDGFYKSTGAVKLSYAGNTYRIENGAIFKLGCYGRSVKQGAILPAVELLKGEVQAKTAQKKPGGIVTTEALLDPRDDETMEFQVTRTLASGNEPTLDQISRWFADTISQPKGTTRATTDGKPIIGVTPYVGPRRGSCRYVHGAKLTSTGTTRKGYFTGTASYTP